MTPAPRAEPGGCMIAIAIPTITPRLERCALDALDRTTPEPHRVIVCYDRTHGEALDWAVKQLTDQDGYLFTMDDDAVPLQRGWLTWLLRKAHGRHAAAFWATARGYPHPLGALYEARWLRSWHIPTFCRLGHFDIGEYLGAALPLGSFIAQKADLRSLPWWLRGCDVAIDDARRPIFAHLGGGTIGHTWFYRGKLYPRIPTWLWPIMVRRYLARLA